MVGNRSPAALYEEAAALWQSLSDEDPDRSILYCEAERRLVTSGLSSDTAGARRAQNWVVALRRYEDFWRAWSRTPRENTRNRDRLPAAERRLGEWARYQRRFEDGLSLYQRIRCDVSPAFVWDLQENAWHTKWVQCSQLLENSGRLPYLNSADQDEFALARWLGRQLRQNQSGTLPEQRRKSLNELLRRANTGQFESRPAIARVIDNG